MGSGDGALKLDMAKAFDRVEWDFLRHLMFHFNFPVSFVSLIFKCLTTASISFSINGQVHGSLKPSRGLRQGDPLSPYLFILCSEGLSAVLQDFQNQNLLSGIAISRQAPSITHLLFADDSFLFCTANRQSCENLHHALSLYSKASGLPQCLSRVKYPAFAFLKDKVANIIHSWNHKWFSRAGKETLIKAILQAIPSYAMACYRIPTKICKEIESLISKFWWGSSVESPKVHWKSWSSVCQSKFVGGLGFRSLTPFNQAMLAKQAWRIFQHPHSLLSKVLKARYFPNSSILEAVPGHRPSFSWRSILWGCTLLKQGLIWKVGNGSDIRTIDDHWLPDSRFKNFSSSSPPSPFLSFFISPSGSWDRGKLNNFFDNILVEDILQVPISGHNCNDTMIWGPEAIGMFTVKSAYHLSLQSHDMPTSSSFTSSKSFWSKIWNSVVPPKVKHLIWRAISHSLPVASSLFFRHIIPTPVCPVCQMQSETVEHDILGCPHAKKAWKYSKFFAFYNTNKDRSFCLFMTAALDAHTKSDLALMFCFIWSIWNQRNNIFHQKTGHSSYQIFDYAANYLHEFLDANAKQVASTPSTMRPIRRDFGPIGGRVDSLSGSLLLDCSNLKHSSGVVAFDSARHVRAGFMVPYSGVVSPEVAEAKAIFAAIEWVTAIQLPVSTIASDCQSVVTKISSSFCNNSVLCDIINAIRNSLLFNPNLKSFAVATGDLFLGLASRLINKPSRGPNGEELASVAMFENYGSVVRSKKERIGAVIEDEIEPDVVWEQSVMDVEAEKQRRVVTSPGFSFSAAGLLFPYHLGVAQFLIENGYIKESTPLAGSSAGAIVCAVIASGASMDEALKATKILAEDCRSKGTAFRLGAVLRDILEKFLPEDVHIRSNGRVRVAVTQILWRPRGLLVDKFDSKEDLINAVFTSSFIPGYLAPKPATYFRNRLCVDGGLTLFMPPTSAKQTVRVCAFPANRLGLEGIGISPDCNPENRTTPREFFNWALEPAEDHILDRLFEFGYRDAAIWAKENPANELVQDGIPLVENGLAQ
uniref:Patatin n=1 Tax=Cannabis sativa TaxID=3483 RepID=A0A803Q8N8_CANSA